jgi:hypothetical protein
MLSTCSLHLIRDLVHNPSNNERHSGLPRDLLVARAWRLLWQGGRGYPKFVEAPRRQGCFANYLDFLRVGPSQVLRILMDGTLSPTQISQSIEGSDLCCSNGCQGITFMRTAAATMPRMRIMSKIASGRLLSTLSTVTNNNKTAKQMATM